MFKKKIICTLNHNEDLEIKNRMYVRGKRKKRMQDVKR